MKWKSSKNLLKQKCTPFRFLFTGISLLSGELILTEEMEFRRETLLKIEQKSPHQVNFEKIAQAVRNMLEVGNDARSLDL